MCDVYNMVVLGIYMYVVCVCVCVCTWVPYVCT
jgi:hypothetical protein